MAVDTVRRPPIVNVTRVAATSPSMPSSGTVDLVAGARQVIEVSTVTVS